MAQVTVIVNGRTYRLMCGPGEESRLTDLADHIRQRIDDLSYEFGNAGDERLLLMAAIMVTDELWDTKARLAEVERRLAEIEGGPVAATTEPEQVEFEPEPRRRADAKPAAAEPSRSAAPLAADNPPAEVTATGTPPALPEPFLQEPSLKRALRKPQQAASKSAIEERLAEARNAATASQRKTGAG